MTHPALTRLLVATRNVGKLNEIRAALPGVEVLPLDAFPGAPEVEETGDTFRENARLKAVSALRATGLPALGDDTGLEVDALDGLPGLHSATYAGPQRSAADNCAKLLAALEDVPDERRTARFRCVLALAEPAPPAPRIFDLMPEQEPGIIHTGVENLIQVTFFEGVVEGTIARAPRGAGGFGYDPLFLVTELGRTMAELSMDEKNRVSHRGRAVAALQSAETVQAAGRSAPGGN